MPVTKPFSSARLEVPFGRCYKPRSQPLRLAASVVHCLCLPPLTTARVMLRNNILGNRIRFQFQVLRSPGIPRRTRTIRRRRWSGGCRHLLYCLENVIPGGHYLAVSKSQGLKRCPRQSLSYSHSHHSPICKKSIYYDASQVLCAVRAPAFTQRTARTHCKVGRLIVSVRVGCSE